MFLIKSWLCAEQRAGERGEPSGQHGAARGGARRTSGAGGAAAEGRSFTRPQEQEAADAAGLRLRAGRQGKHRQSAEVLQFSSHKQEFNNKNQFKKLEYFTSHGVFEKSGASHLWMNLNLTLAESQI